MANFVLVCLLAVFALGLFTCSLVLLKFIFLLNISSREIFFQSYRWYCNEQCQCSLRGGLGILICTFLNIVQRYKPGNVCVIVFPFKFKIPSFKNFTGTISQIDSHKFLVQGNVEVVDNKTIEISELPVGIWTQVYKENVLEPMLHGSEKIPPILTWVDKCLIQTNLFKLCFKERSTALTLSSTKVSLSDRWNNSSTIDAL